MLSLSIETSCDETAIALVEFNAHKKKIKILTHRVSSQIKLHRKFGGVVPMLASREHAKNLPIVLRQVFGSVPTRFDKSNHPLRPASKIDVIFVTQGPGLIPCLLLGVNFARALAYRFSAKIIPVNHLLGHLYSPLISAKKRGWQTLKKIKFPAISLIVSGGHTNLLLLKNLYEYKVLGETRDDAAGEAFDKVGRLLDLPYPAGPELEKLAKEGNPEAFNFPRPMIAQKNYEFSFAGLKTSVLYTLSNPKNHNTPELSEKDRPQKSVLGSFGWNSDISDRLKADIAASFQKAVIDVLTSKTMRAVQEFQAKTLLVGGGVINNKALQLHMKSEIRKSKSETKILFPDKELTTDNALMIALAGMIQLAKGVKPRSWKYVDANANLRL